MNISVRSLSPQDLEWVIEADQSFPHPWAENEWRNLSNAEHCFVLEMNAKLVGYALFRHLPGDVQGHLLKIFLNGKYRGQGLAERLLKNASDQLGLQEIFLEVGETNFGARKFYEKLGFKQVHLVRGFYSNGENACLMLLTR